MPWLDAPARSGLIPHRAGDLASAVGVLRVHEPGTGAQWGRKHRNHLDLEPVMTTNTSSVTPRAARARALTGVVAGLLGAGANVFFALALTSVLPWVLVLALPTAALAAWFGFRAFTTSRAHVSGFAVLTLTPLLALAALLALF
jgi:hypothetical protein